MVKLFFAALFMSTLSFTLAAEPVELINRTTCTQHSETREIEIVAKDTGHSVNYTKSGKTEEVGSCMSNKKKCREVFDRLKAKLIRSGFNCQT